MATLRSWWMEGAEMMTKQKPTPEEVSERLRGIRSEIEDEVKEMTFEQRRDLRNKTKTSREIIVASISAVGMSDKVANALGRSAEDVQELISTERRWGRWRRICAPFSTAFPAPTFSGVTSSP